MASSIPANQARFSLAELIEATGGATAESSLSVCGVTTDTRAGLEGSAFVALVGESFDGHAFAAEARQRGARLVVAERELADAPGLPVLRVPSTLAALGALARYQRLRWGGRVVAVAGSVGKTTTRTAVRSLLSAAGASVWCPAGNLNNRVGVPMVLLGVLPEHDLAVVEIGTSLPGEVAALTDVARPDVAVLTRIAVEHAEGLGDIDAIEAEEGALLRGLTSQAVAVVNGDDERCSRQLERSPASRQIRYGQSGPGLAYRIESVETTRTGRTSVAIRRPRGPTLRLETELVGLPAAYALTAGLAAAESVLLRPLEPDEAQSGALARELGEPGRLARCELVDGSLLLDDSYNSSPASARSSLDAAAELARQRGARLLLVLGEMRELGRFAQSEHRDLGQYLAALAPALVIAFGEHAERMIEAPVRAGIEAVAVADAPAAAEVALGRRRAGDVILVKASRSLRAERIVQALVAGDSPERAEPPARIPE